MAKISRRRLLSGLLAGGAITLVPSIVPRLARRALAQSAEAAYPTIFIHLSGGLDTVMHWDAKTGLPNRNVQAADIRETASGIRWYQPTLAPLAAHMEDAVLVRNIRVSSAHPAGTGLLWWGEGREGTAANATPWANHLSSELLVRKRVPAPTLATFRTTDEALQDLIGLSNISPDPVAAAQRIQGIGDFSSSLDVLGGMPPVETQDRIYQLVDQQDLRLYSSAVQSRTNQGFLAANTQATELLFQPPPLLWPPAQTTQDAFNLSNADINNTIGQNNQRFSANVAMAFEAARLQMSHVVFIQVTEGGYDTHEGNDQGQRARSNQYMPAIGRLLTALKNTASPIDPEQSMFDTTHVVITSELSRAARRDEGTNVNGQIKDGTGTPHNDWTQAAIFGGKFKRGFAFGAMNNSLQGIPANLQTGQLNEGTVPNIKNLHATVLKANGVNPSGWTSEAPIDALLRG